jgi:hypothetical protein
MIDFYLPERERKSKRPYGLTRLQVKMLQEFADDERPKDMTTPSWDARCIWNMAWRIRVQMGVVTTAGAVAKGIREGIIK